MTYSHMDNSTLPSALRGFTSEFGKGSGGSLLLLSPAHLFMDFFGSYLRCLFRMPYFVPNELLTGIFELDILSSFITKSSCLQ